MKVTIERDGCIGCGLCAGTCPNVFEIIEDGRAQVIKQPASLEDEEAALDAAASCPVEVIKTEKGEA